MGEIAMRRAFTVWLVLAASANGATIEPLGTFFASGVSRNGEIVVGTASTSTGNQRVLWRDGALTLLGGMEDQEHVFAQAISADGSTVVGEDYNVIAYRWREATGYTSLSPLGIAWATSGDGSVVVGQSLNGAFRWTESAGPQYISEISGGGFAETATDVSLDGSVLVGSGGAANGQIGVVFRWDASNGAVPLGEYPYGQAQGALATNSFGSIVVGSTVLNGVEEAFRWTEADGLVGLGHLPEHVDTLFAMTAAVALTDHGSLIVGNETVAAGETGVFAWTAADGMRPLDDYLVEEYGLDLTGWALTSIVDMTPDGRVLVAQAMHPQFGQNVAVRIVVPEPSLAALGLCSTLALAAQWALKRRLLQHELLKLVSPI